MKQFKPVLALVLVFAAGTVFGIVATRMVTRHFIHRVLTHPELVREKIERDLKRKLRLNAQQEQRVHETLLDAHQKINALRKEFQPQFAGIISNTETQVSVILTPDQREKFGRIIEENRKILPFTSQSSP